VVGSVVEADDIAAAWGSVEDESFDDDVLARRAPEIEKFYRVRDERHLFSRMCRNANCVLPCRPARNENVVFGVAPLPAVQEIIGGEGGGFLRGGSERRIPAAAIRVLAGSRDVKGPSRTRWITKVRRRQGFPVVTAYER